jgi:hypothetical protein
MPKLHECQRINVISSKEAEGDHVGTPLHQIARGHVWFVP